MNNDLRNYYLRVYFNLMKDYVTKTTLDEIINRGFASAPASTRFHLAEYGGLLKHSINVTNELVTLTKRLGLDWNDTRSPYIVGMFHDICKIDAYIADENGQYKHNKETLLNGHGDKSVMILSEYMQLTEEEIMCIRYHMGAFSTSPDDWNDYTRAIHKYPNVLYAQTKPGLF